MGFTKNLRKENRFTAKCADRKFKCLSFPEPNYVFSITEKIYEIYSLNQKIYELTTELWNNFLTVIHKKEFIYEKGVCYDILNPKNCDDLHIHYHIFNEKLILYQQSYFDMPENESNYLLKELSDLLLGFLDSPLFSLGNNIKHLIIRIQKPDMSNVEESYIDLSTEKEVDKMLNEFLIAYLQFLSDLLDRFNLTYDSLKLNNLKEVIKTRITSIKIQKKEYLKRLSVYKPILNPTTSTTLDGSDDHSITPSIFTEKLKKVTQTDHTTTSDFSYNTKITRQYSTE
ncbi:hypothetical protein NBO_7g0035 [Nosema bombycis CQ1]|uniref:Uncharacterized protein n=1 Tax=Nosema bombycis (strain CQ1 / CVCC 102059) TaxID=578461 RepID=R0KYC1_NOSB1|nr:hypothetical protein NBO_7g0035 [Nosema bombycis CQ1]|eukprot:EOB15217.1 hypothetical protein NBO_7g0035 [Nosema bombycis CQ1]